MLMRKRLLARKVVHQIDALWCDVHGVYVQGWAHARDVPVQQAYLWSGQARVDIGKLKPRHDLRAYFPDLHGSAECGFAAYLPCAPFRPVLLGLVTPLGTVEIDV